MENVPLSHVPYSDRNYPNASMYHPIFRMFRHLMCINHQGEFDLQKYRSRLQYEGMPADPTFYMTPENAAKVNALSDGQREDWDNSRHWEDLSENKIMTSDWF